MTRGHELEQSAIERRKSSLKGKKSKPLSTALQKKLCFAGGRKVPASLQTWLAFDTDWIELSIAAKGEIESDRIDTTLDERFPEMGPWDDFQLLLPAPVVL